MSDFTTSIFPPGMAGMDFDLLMQYGLHGNVIKD